MPSTEYSLASEGGSITATNELSPTYAAANLIDGNDANIYHSSGGFPITIEITLPFPVLIDQIYLGFVSNQTRSYLIQALVGGSWVTKETVTSAYEGSHTLNPTPFAATKVRYVVSADNYTIVRLLNFKVFGTPAPDANPPTVSITSPSTGGASISGNQNIVVSCSDDVHVVQLDLLVDGVIVDTFTDTNITGHTFVLDTTKFPNGDRDIKVRANDGHNDTDSDTITKTFANTFTITGSAKLASSGSDTYTTNIPDPVWSKDSGGGSINASTGVYTAPSSGLGVAVLRATGEFGSTQTKNVLYGFPYVHNNGNSREFAYSELPEGYQFKARVKSLDEQSNTLGFTAWEEQP